MELQNANVHVDHGRIIGSIKRVKIGQEHVQLMGALLALSWELMFITLMQREKKSFQCATLAISFLVNSKLKAEQKFQEL